MTEVAIHLALLPDEISAIDREFQYRPPCKRPLSGPTKRAHPVTAPTWAGFFGKADRAQAA